MEMFDLFDVYTYEQNVEQTACECTHTNTILECGVYICISCGFELMEKEDRSNVSFTNGNYRCYARKSDDTSIYIDIDKITDVDDRIKEIANKLYYDICQTSNLKKRSKNRRGILCAAVFHAYKLDKNPRTPDSLIKLFNIKRKDMLNGLKFFDNYAPSSSPIRKTYITPEHLINEFMNYFLASPEMKRDIRKIYNTVKNANVLSKNRSKSIAAGIIYYYLTTHNKKIDLEKFISKIELSAFTVVKVAKKIAEFYTQGDSNPDHDQNPDQNP